MKTKNGRERSVKEYDGRKEKMLDKIMLVQDAMSWVVSHIVENSYKRGKRGGRKKS